MFRNKIFFQVKLGLADLIVDYSRARTGEKVRMLRRHQEGPESAGGILLELDYRSAKVNAPNFEKVYGNTAQLLAADFVGLNVVLDHDALIELKQFGNEMQEELANLMPPPQTPIAASTAVEGKETSIVVATKGDGKASILD